MKRQGTRGQSMVEMSLLFICVIAGLIFLAPYVQRAAQGMAKGNADSMGGQYSATTQWSSASVQLTHEEAYNTDTGACSSASQGIGGAGGAVTGCQEVTPAGYVPPP